MFTRIHYFLAPLLWSGFAGAWLFWSDGSSEDSKVAEVNQETKEASSFQQVGFEMLTQDERIQKELAAIKEMSPMGSCYYRVLEDLKQSCGSLSEEEIGKLSVQLLNCQSEVENRRTFRCTNHMTVGECTRDMDPTIWNSYQIVSNRARAICYQVRQQQFKIKTELTVDKLVRSSEFQLQNLKHMQDRQSHLKTLADEAISSLSEGHERLKTKQEGMQKLQTSLEEHMTLSLEQLEQQRVLAERGTELISTMADRVQDKLDIVAERIEQKDAQLATNQDQLLSDLHHLKSVAESVGELLTETQAAATEERSASLDRYRDVIATLERINETAVYVATVLVEVKASLERQLDWIYRLLDETGADLNDLKTIGLHVAYILMTMLILSFLGSDALTRWISIFVLVLNCILTIQLQMGQQPIQIVLAFVVVCMGRGILSLSMKVKRNRKQPKSIQLQDIPSHMHNALSTPDIKKVIQVLENYTRKESLGKIAEESPSFFPPQTPPPPSPTNLNFGLKPVNTPLSAKRSLLRNMDEGSIRERCYKSLSPSCRTRTLRSESDLRISSTLKNIAKARGVSPSRYSRSKSPSRATRRTSNVQKITPTQKMVEEQDSP